MSSIYKHLSQEVLDVEKRQELPDPILREVPTPKSSLVLRIAVIGAVLLSITALAGAGVLYQTLNAEKRERKALSCRGLSPRVSPNERPKV